MMTDIFELDLYIRWDLAEIIFLGRGIKKLFCSQKRIMCSVKSRPLKKRAFDYSPILFHGPDNLVSSFVVTLEGNYSFIGDN